MMDRKLDDILSTTSRFYSTGGPRAGLAILFSIAIQLENHRIYFPLFHFLIPILLAFHLLIPILIAGHLLVAISLAK